MRRKSNAASPGMRYSESLGSVHWSKHERGRPQKLLDVRPFEPLEVELSSGQVFHIKHPENVIVTKHTLIVVEPENNIVQWTSLIHIVAVRGENGPHVAK